MKLRLNTDELQAFLLQVESDPPIRVDALNHLDALQRWVATWTTELLDVSYHSVGDFVTVYIGDLEVTVRRADDAQWLIDQYNDLQKELQDGSGEAG